LIEKSTKLAQENLELISKLNSVAL